ncbi:YihY/virulence factor BrkB family protein [Streptomyces sp. NPDC052040]|uniref:YihY/virulence factor BrkB family protein n=1 Tax=unclassified Streptomyces TaxID=2593676 RepID=UPI0037D58C84
MTRQPKREHGDDRDHGDHGNHGEYGDHGEYEQRGTHRGGIPDGTGGAPVPRESGPGSATEPPGPGPGPEIERRAPDGPTELSGRSWRAVFKGTLREFRNDELTDRAAALTYYGVLSLFPALLVLVSLLGTAGRSTTDTVLDNLKRFAPGSARNIITRAVEQLQGHSATGSVMAIAGLALALWSASGYIAAFIRTANVVYDMPEGRPIWKVLPLRIAVTLVLVVLAMVSALIVVFTGGLARQAGSALGIGHTALTVWSVAKWPVLAVLITVMIAILYWAAPNAKVPGFRWVSPGSVLALVIWLAASGGFAVYVTNFAAYNKTYGTMAGVIVFLVWLWIGNLAILLGLEFDAETARQRAIAGGLPPDQEPYAEPRDTRAWDEEDRRRLEE